MLSLVLKIALQLLKGRLIALVLKGIKRVL